MAGSATFTIETSRTTMNWARQTTMRMTESEERGRPSGRLTAAAVEGVGDPDMHRGYA